MRIVEKFNRIIRRYLAFTLFLPAFIFSNNLSGQVINNDIEQRIELYPDSTPFTSNTSGCTVQKACVDQSLTGKCIQYHNDQWFFFNAGTTEKLYINITGQNCRDDQGVQIVVLEGIPCEPSTYKVKTCVSLASHDDIFLRLDTLTSNEPYLINVDGYLNDFCEFQIDISTKSRGIPAQVSNHEVNFKLKKKENSVEIAWTYPGAIDNQIYFYEIYRRKSGKHKSTHIATVTHERNSYGASKFDYSYLDTLKQNGTYFYKVVGLGDKDDSYLLAEKSVTMQGDKLSKAWITVRPDFNENASLRALLLDRLTQNILLRKDFYYTKKNKTLDFFVEPYLKSGVKAFEVVVVDMNTNERKVYFFDM